MQQLVQLVVAFLLQGVPTSTRFATATHNMAAGSAFGLLTDCLQQGLPIGKGVALWGPSVCRYGCLLLWLCTGLPVSCGVALQESGVTAFCMLVGRETCDPSEPFCWRDWQDHSV